MLKGSSPHVTAIAGGIGSGKSVVSRALRAMGYEVYDCDSRAKALMDSDCEIHAALCRDIHPRSVTGGVIDRPLLSRIVFSDAEKLIALNRIVHAAVRTDFAAWCEEHGDEARLFVETAILTESRLHHQVDDVWEVTAPEALRIRRVMARNGLSAEAVKARVDSQRPLPRSLAIPVHRIINDGLHPLLPQLEALLRPANNPPHPR